MPFGRKNRERTPAAEEEQPVAAPAKRTGKKRKPQELLSSVINESAIGAAIDALKNNAPFALPNDSGWVGLLLSVDEIGGLSQKQKGDATKGSIIELIASDAIQVIATKPMLDSEFLGFIPTTSTLERMDEYSLLTDAPYHFVVFRSEDDGNNLVVDTPRDSETTFAVAQAIANGDTSVAAVLPEVWSHFGGAQAAAAPTALGSEADFDRVLVGANVGEASALADEADRWPASRTPRTSRQRLLRPCRRSPSSTTTPSKRRASISAPERTPASSSTRQRSPRPSPRRHRRRRSCPTWTRPRRSTSTGRTMPRRPLPDRQPTLASLMPTRTATSSTSARTRTASSTRRRCATRSPAGSSARPRPRGRHCRVRQGVQHRGRGDHDRDAADSTDWLGSQAAQLSRQANAELQTLRQFHQDELRELFVEVMAKHIEKTNADVSTDTPGSQYYDLMNGAKQDFETKRAAAPQEVAAARESIIERFNAAANSRAEQAAAHARAQYEDKNRPKLERDLAEAGAEIDRRIEEQYAHDRTTVLDLRRKDANLLMDIGTNRVFEYLREVQDGQRKAERELLETWNGRLVAFIDENRQGDIARAMVLADQLARQNEVETLKAEHRTAVRDLRREHAEREQELARERERIRQEAVAELEARRGEWSASVEVEKSQREAAGTLVAQLQTQIGELSKRYEQQYEGQIATLKADKDAITLELDRQHASHKRGLYLLIALGVVLVVAAVAVGIIAGWSWGHNQAVTTTPAASAALGSLLP